MKTLVILRPELLCIALMLFLLVYDRYCAKFRVDEHKNTFFKLALLCLGHCVLALVTEITVNTSAEGNVLNNACHILFFLTAIFYSFYYLEYILYLILPTSGFRKKYLIGTGVLGFIIAIIMIASPIRYIESDFTNYSTGLAPILGFAVAAIFTVVADIIIICKRQSIEKAVVTTTLPLSLVALGLFIIQIFNPEFLVTSQALTLTAVGLFFAIENPIEKFMTQTYFDYNVNVWNRNCYDNDMKNIIPDNIEQGAKLTYVMGDINGLKSINDNLGHAEGDKLILKTARYLCSEMSSVFKIYRTGGDEFVAIYFDTPIETIEAEVKAVEEKCSTLFFNDELPVGISIGYAERKDTTLKDTLSLAESMMYDKKKHYYSKQGFERRRK